MRNRSILSLPAVLDDQKPSIPFSDSRTMTPGELFIYDVTYLHFHPYMEIGLCLKGTGICYVEDKEFPFAPGDVQVIFPYQRHLSQNTVPVPGQWYWLTFDPAEVLEQAGFYYGDQVSQWILYEMGICGIVDPVKYPEICECIRRIVQDATPPERAKTHSGEMLATDVLRLILLLCQASQPLEKLKLETGRHLIELAPALEMLRQQLEQEALPAVEEMGRACGMSPANFRRVFRREMGCSPREYLTACRIHKAKKLLAHTGRSITEIAASVGYQDISGFNRSFLSFTGMTPSRFRRSMRPEPHRLSAGGD